MSFLFDIGERSANAVRFIASVHEQLLIAFTQERKNNKLTKKKMADLLNTNKSAIHRQLSGEANLTLRSIADLAWAMDREIEFKLVEKQNDYLHPYAKIDFWISADSAPPELFTIPPKNMREVNPSPEIEV